jgi:YfiH family protein
MMICHKKIRIFFGDKKDAVDKENQLVLNQISWQQVTDCMQAEKLFGVHQSHGINGIHIKKTTDQHQSILVDADFLITNQIGCGLAVTTADCVPVVIYDPSSQAVALVHAGWKGIMADIISAALNKMKQLYNSDMKKVEIFIGPAARKCCYEIQADMHELFKKEFPLFDAIFNYTKDKIFLDLVTCVQYRLLQNNVLIENIYQQFACCTLCNDRYCSYRREKNQLRNINAVVLCE